MRPEFQHAFERAEDSYQSAEILYSHQRYAGAINRSYYAMFYLVEALVHERKNKHVKTHSGLKKVFNEELKSGEISKDLFKLFKDVFDNRLTADYDLDSEISEENAKNALRDCKLFFDALRKFMDKE